MGKHATDQMVWHVNQFLGFSLGEGSAPQRKSPIPGPIFGS